MIPVNTPHFGCNEKKYLAECIDSGWVSSDGPFVKRFEEAFSASVNKRYGIAVSSGTAALDIAIALLDIGPGDEVILPAFTIISCVNEIIRRGATPVLIDSDALTWNMDVSQVESRITPRTKAIMAVHTYGLPVDMVTLEYLSHKYEIPIIEDAAQAHGLSYWDEPCGSMGDIATFSFYANKTLTTGEGGMVLVNEERLYNRAIMFRNLCFRAHERFVHYELGWNYRMTNLQAAVGLAQLEQLDDAILAKRSMGVFYGQELTRTSGIVTPLDGAHGSFSTYWVYGLLADMGAKAMMQQLADLDIQTRRFFCPMHMQPVLTSRGLFAGEHYPVAERLYEQGFYIPSGVGITRSEQEQVVAAVRKVLGYDV